MNRKLKARIVEMFGTQADFAQAIGVDDAIISKVVRGRRSLSAKNQMLWEQKLDCSSEIFAH